MYDEVFMDDLSVFGDSFDDCLNHLKLVLAMCVEKGLVLNWNSVISWSLLELC